MQINKIFIKLIKGQEVKLRNPEELARLVKYCQSVCYNYGLNIKINGRTLRAKMNFSSQPLK